MVNKRVKFKFPRFLRGLISQKRGVSDVIATVLILLLTITSIGVLVAVLIPFVQNNLDESGDCLNVRGGISIVKSDSCYMPEDNPITPEIEQIRTVVKIKVGNIDIDGIYLIFDDGGTPSKSFEIVPGKTFSELNNNQPLILPQKGGGEKTYTLNNEFFREVSVGAMVKDKRCPNPDSDKLELCINQ